MRWIIVTLVAASCAAVVVSRSTGLGAASPIEALGMSPANRPAPAFLLPTLDGTEQGLGDFRGKVVFVNFWATWCEPCRDEMPTMERLYTRLKDRGLVVVAISIDGQGAGVVRPFVNELKFSYPILLDVGMDTARAFGVRGIPTTVIINRQGIIIGTVFGGRPWDGAPVITAMQALLAE